MIKKIFLVLISIVVLNANEVENKIQNIIGFNKYTENKGLIQHLFSNTSKYYKNSSLDYILVMETLKQNGLLDVGFNQPQNVTIVFNINHDPIKSLKIISDSLKALGYYHYFTKHLLYDESQMLTWTINLKTEAAIDPLMLSKELFKHSCLIVDIKKEGFKWMYSVDTSNSTISQAKEVIAGEKVDFRKPLKPYFLKVNEAKNIFISSRIGNQWFPQVVFYDKHLNILNIVKEKEEHQNLKLDIPEYTRYIKIDDLFTLSNIKRGLSVMIKE